MNCSPQSALILLLLLSCALLGVAQTGAASANLALGKPYAVSSEMNYPRSAPSSDKSVLTDGRYTTGHFWTQNSTAGWQGKRYVEIMVDLEESAPVDKVTFNTARNLSDVSFPAHIHVFLGADKNHLAYLGDMVQGADHSPTEYEVRRFSLSNIGSRGRYLLLVVEAKGYYLFCDEIEVLGGGEGTANRGKLTIESARSLVKQRELLETEKKLLKNLLREMHSLVAANPELADDLVRIERQIDGMTSAEEQGRAFGQLLELRRQILQKRYPREKLLIEPIDPWQQISPVFVSSDAARKPMRLSMPVNGYGYAAFAITNISSSSRTVRLTLDPVALASVSFHSLQFVKTASFEHVPDILAPLGGSFSVTPGESRVILLSARGEASGRGGTRLKVTDGKEFRFLPVDIQVGKVSLAGDLHLNGVNWGYLDSEVIAGKKKEAVRDLLAHHTRAIVVPSTLLPLASLDQAPRFDDLVSYLSLHKGATKVILFMAYGGQARMTSAGRYTFMNPEWKDAFRQWYRLAVEAAAKAGFQEEQLYLYPYDEMTSGQADQFIALSSWAKKAIPGIKFYATIDKKDALKALDHLDISQIHAAILDAIPVSKSRLWIYDSKGPAKSLSPYSYYRLMAWKAFLHGYQGAGFWSYADASGSVHDDFDGEYPDYAVVYRGADGSILSSRRWEAWRAGIEDHQLLTMYARKQGEVAAKALAKTVLDAPDDTSRADLVRRQILQEL